MYNNTFYEYFIKKINHKQIFYLTNYQFLKKFTNKKTFLGHKIGKKFGIQKSSVDSSMIDFLLGNRSKVSFINIKITMKKIIKNLYLLLKIIKHNGHVLIVNTNPEIGNIIKCFARKTEKNKNNFSFCNSKWVGGTLTNWNQISTSIATFLSFSKRFGKFIIQNNIHFPKYRKLKKSFQGFTLFSNNLYVEQSLIRENFLIKGKKLSSKKQGKGYGKQSLLSKQPIAIKLNLKKPDILIIVNPNENMDVLYEAKNLNIPVIGLTDSNTDLRLITYPIPVNNNSLFFVQFFFSWFAKLLMLKKN